MSKLEFAVLGTGNAQRDAVGNKGRLLDRAKRANLMVPNGILVLDETFDGLLAGSPDLDQKLTRISQQLVERLTTLGIREPYAVRSAFSAEDTQGSAMAGHFKSKLFVDQADVGDAFIDVWHSADAHGQGIRRDIMIMSMVDAMKAGVAFTERDFEDDLINYCAGTAEALVSGQVAGDATSLPKLRSFEKSLPESASVQPFLQRLQLLLRDVRLLFGEGDWDIEWADNGAHCYLVQIRPITRHSRRNEAFTLANHREILPDLPSPFMTSLIASCADKLFDYYREFDGTLPAGRPFIEVFAGRPLINLSLLTDMMRILGLPSTLVTRNIGGVDYGGNTLNGGRLVRKLPVLLAMGMSQLQATGRARAATEQMFRRTSEERGTVSECVQLLQWLYCSIVRNMQALTAAMSAPLAILRRLNVLEEHTARHSTISSQMYTDLAPLRDLVASDATLRAAVLAGQVPEDQRFQELWLAYLAKHGHRGVYESDIARPRLSEDPGWLLGALSAPQPPAKPLPPRTIAGFLTQPIWWWARRAITGREQVRYQSMKAMGRIRQNLLRITRDKLSQPDDLWLLSIDEARSLDGLNAVDPGLMQSARAANQAHQDYSLPDMVHRFDDLEQFGRNRNALTDLSGTERLKGVSLTSGRVSGIALVLREPPRALPPELDGKPIVLVARSVDAGWIPVFSQVKGVVVEIGGDLSHGSIILREIGLPAITNVQGATQGFRDGDSLLLDADSGTVTRVTGS
jgi:pyruvate,water dikinase